MAVMMCYYTDVLASTAKHDKLDTARPMLSAIKKQAKESNGRQYMIYSDIRKDCPEGVR